MAKKKPELSNEELLAEALVKEEDWPYQVPGNWVWTRIGFLFDVTSSKRVFKNDWTLEGIPFYRTRELVKLSENGHVDNELYISEEMYEEYKNKYGAPLENDLLISGVGTIGKAYAVPQNTKFYFKDGNIIWFKNKSKTNAKYIFYLYKSNFILNQIKLLASGSTVDTYTIISAKNTIIPLPPFAEQQRIVDRIESLFDQLDQAKDLIQAALDSFETRKAAILHQAFTGELSKKWREAHGMELESWKETKSESIFEYVTSGSRGWAQYYDTKGSVFIRMGNLDHGTIELDLADIQYVKLPENVEGKRSKVEKNDVLISITADVGMVGLVRNENMDAYINQHVALARPVKSVNAEFIAWFLVSDIGLHQLQSLQRGVTKIGLTLGDIRNLIIKLPCLSEQIEIVRILDDLFAKEQNAKDLCDLIDQIEAIKKTILGQAFRGDLGTNEAGEESAVALLKEVLAKKIKMHLKYSWNPEGGKV